MPWRLRAACLVRAEVVMDAVRPGARLPGRHAVGRRVFATWWAVVESPSLAEDRNRCGYRKVKRAVAVEGDMAGGEGREGRWCGE